MNVGIDLINFYIPKYYLNMNELAKLRGIDENKYSKGIGQNKMSIISPLEDIVTMAAEASYDIVKENKKYIDTILFATESSIDFSKAAGNYLHKILGLSPSVRILEFKQACYAATGALQLAADYVRSNPNKKVLVVSSDVAWYGFENAGESTQGAGAIAMLVSKDPKIAIVNKGKFVTDEISDFYRPSYQEVPTVDGKLSIKSYIKMLKLLDPQEKYIFTCFHMPFAKMADKANATLKYPISDEHLRIAKYFTSEVGNIYNGSLFLSLISVLTLSKIDLSNQSIGMFSYGSGAIGEFFSLKLSNQYEKYIDKEEFLRKLKDRIELTSEEYINFMKNYQIKETTHKLINYNKSLETNRFIIDSIKSGQRTYKKIA